MPAETRLAHEYCFFLHDECVRMLVEYEKAKASDVEVQFKDKAESKKFSKIAKENNAITALRVLDRGSEARRVVLNTITMAMVSDCAHHLYESLRCFEKRKFVPAFNLLRKPLLDSLMYLSWMVADEDDFYTAFSSGDPTQINQKIIGNRRKEIIEKALGKTELTNTIQSDDIVSTVFDSRNENGLYGLFQHAVHLITVDRIEIKTAPENFNFIFKHPFDDDIYETLYATLPTVLLYMAHLVMLLFDQIKPMDADSKNAFALRTINGYRFIQSEENAIILAEAMGTALSPIIKCETCGTALKVTLHNAARLLFTDTYRCSHCGKNSPFPLSSIL
ncbi:MAG: hypothetical protein K2Y31_16390 [Burkholderiales bacterium]|nr:hypothetical protein [Burkholderiales bacterium]